MKKGVVNIKHPLVQKKINKSLDVGIDEAAVASVSTNFNLPYFSPAALALGASNVEMGILHAVISLLPSFVQLKGADLIEKYQRKKIVLTAILGKIFLMFAFLLIGYLHYIGVNYMVPVFIFVVGIHYVLVAILRPAWFSWMGSLVSEKDRGKYFARKNRVTEGFGILAMIVGAVILDFVKEIPGYDLLFLTLVGFGILFVLSDIFRIASYALVGKIYEPRIKIRKKDKFSLRDFLSHCRENPFGRFSLFVGAISFAVGISSPFVAVYMLNYLGFSYVWYISVIVAALLFQMIFLPLFGKFSDRFGNIRLIQTCAFASGFTPFFWLLSVFIEGDLILKIYLLIVPSAFAGFSWAGYNLALNNYVYDSVSSRKRGFGVSYMNFLIGIGGFAGASLGAFLAWIDVSFMNPILFIFFISGIFRFFIVIYGGRFLSEVRKVSRFSNKFWVREFGPANELAKEVHNFEHLLYDVEHFVLPKDKKKFG